MSWNYRIIVETFARGEMRAYIGEVYYNEKNEPTSWTGPINTEFYSLGDEEPAIVNLCKSFRLMSVALDLLPLQIVYAEDDEKRLRPRMVEMIEVDISQCVGSARDL